MILHYAEDVSALVDKESLAGIFLRNKNPTSLW
jgi:hypothetical protein